MGWFFIVGLILLFVFTVCAIESDSREMRGIFTTISLLVVAVMFLVVIADVVQPYDNLLNECQQDLPRNEKCILIAVPEYTLGE